MLKALAWALCLWVSFFTRAETIEISEDTAERITILNSGDTLIIRNGVTLKGMVVLNGGELEVYENSSITGRVISIVEGGKVTCRNSTFSRAVLAASHTNVDSYYCNFEKRLELIDALNVDLRYNTIPHLIISNDDDLGRASYLTLTDNVVGKMSLDTSLGTDFRSTRDTFNEKVIIGGGKYLGWVDRTVNFNYATFNGKVRVIDYHNDMNIANSTFNSNVLVDNARRISFNSATFNDAKLTLKDNFEVFLSTIITSGPKIRAVSNDRINIWRSDITGIVKVDLEGTNDLTVVESTIDSLEVNSTSDTVSCTITDSNIQEQVGACE